MFTVGFAWFVLAILLVHVRILAHLVEHWNTGHGDKQLRRAPSRKVLHRGEDPCEL